MLVGLDALRYRLETQRAGEIHDGGDDTPVLGVIARTVHEGALYLEVAHREAFQVGGRGVAGAEVVQGDADA